MFGSSTVYCVRGCSVSQTIICPISMAFLSCIIPAQPTAPRSFEKPGWTFGFVCITSSYHALALHRPCKTNSQSCMLCILCLDKRDKVLTFFVVMNLRRKVNISASTTPGETGLLSVSRTIGILLPLSIITCRLPWLKTPFWTPL